MTNEIANRMKESVRVAFETYLMQGVGYEELTAEDLESFAIACSAALNDHRSSTLFVLKVIDESMVDVGDEYENYQWMSIPDIRVAALVAE